VPASASMLGFKDPGSDFESTIGALSQDQLAASFKLWVNDSKSEVQRFAHCVLRISNR
jgi:hypothetical protein